MNWSSDKYFKRPRIEDDYYYSSGEFEGAGRQPLGPRTGFRNESMQRDPGYVNFKAMSSANDVLAKVKGWK